MCYDVRGFLERNSERMNPDLRALVRSSTLSLMKELVAMAMSGDEESSASPSRGRRRKVETVSSTFRHELGELIEVLRNSSTQFIRCIKPSDAQSPGQFDGARVLEQVSGKAHICMRWPHRIGCPIMTTDDTKQWHVRASAAALQRHDGRRQFNGAGLPHAVHIHRPDGHVSRRAAM